MKFFSIPTIKAAIEGLARISGNWLLPTFVFAANDVGLGELVDLSKRLGTDQFLDRYFNGKRVGLPDFPSGNNLLRPRFRDIRWDRGPFAGDFMIRQNTKMWGNLFSSRGYREMRLEGLIEGEKAITSLTAAFQPRLEGEIPSSFRFEDFLVWLFAFEGIPDQIDSWPELMDHLLRDELNLTEFKPPYRTRFRLSDPEPPWPDFLEIRPANEEYLAELAPKLLASLATEADESADEEEVERLGADDDLLARIRAAIQAKESLAFLLAGPPGTGKTRYARQLAKAIADDDSSRMLFLQFHPAIGYDDFIEGFRPVQIEDETGSGVRYKLEPRLFLNFSKRASADLDHKYVVVIDELNRGDVARIFGEVLTYVEVAYRGTEFTLPFSGERASLPKNLIIIATANPFDRSVTDLDDALLRRFWVIEMEPDGTFLKSYLQQKGLDEALITRTHRVFTLLNEAFPNGFGHTTFLGVRSIEDLAAVWTGRLRLTLRRALMHDREAYEARAAEIESLLSEDRSD